MVEPIEQSQTEVMIYPDIRLPAIGPGFSGSVQYKNSVHLSITIRRGPKPQMYRSCLLLQEWSPDVNFFCGPAKQLNARDQEIPSRQCGQFLGTKCIHDRSDTGPVYLACAHGTRFTTRIECAAADLLRQKMFNCHCHQIGFRVGGWIAIRIYRILRLQNDLVVQDEKRSKRVVTRRSGLEGQFNRLP